MMNRPLVVEHRVLWAALLVAVLTMSLAACGGGDDDAGTTTAPTDVAATNTPDSGDDAPATSITAADGDDSDDGDPMDGPSDDTMLPTSFKVTGRDNFFDFDVIEAPANTEITVELFNDGVLPHNIAFLTKEGGVPLSNDAHGSIILEGETTVMTFTTPAAGTYFFNCTVHPLEMKGTFIVK